MSYEKKDGLPPAGIDGFLSHFNFSFRVNRGEYAGNVYRYTWPSAVQSVARSEPFIYRKGETHRATFPLPKGSTLPDSMTEADFLTIPEGFFENGKETAFLQILNLSATGEMGEYKSACFLGQTFKDKYPDIFQPSFGAVQSLGRQGLPAKIFFVPNGIFVTPFGDLHTRPKALVGDHIDAIPPVGSSPKIQGAIELDAVEELRAKKVRAFTEGEGTATLTALDHPIDGLLNIAEGELFQYVQTAIATPPLTRG